MEAFNETNDGPASSFVAPDTVPWCAELENGTLPADYHINVTFAEPLVLTLLMSGGFINGFVNNFTIAYSASVDDDNLTVYGVTEDVTVSSISVHGYICMGRVCCVVCQCVNHAL